MSTYAEQLANAAPTVSINPVPLNFNVVGDKFRGVYVGEKVFNKIAAGTGEIKPIPTAYFSDGAKIVFCGGKQLMGVIHDNGLAVGTSVELTLVELRRSSHPQPTKIYSVAILNLPAVTLEQLFGMPLQIAPPAQEYFSDAPALPAPTAPAPAREIDFY